VRRVVCQWDRLGRIRRRSGSGFRRNPVKSRSGRRRGKVRWNWIGLVHHGTAHNGRTKQIGKLVRRTLASVMSRNSKMVHNLKADSNQRSIKPNCKLTIFSQKSYWGLTRWKSWNEEERDTMRCDARHVLIKVITDFSLNLFRTFLEQDNENEKVLSSRLAGVRVPPPIRIVRFDAASLWRAFAVSFKLKNKSFKWKVTRPRSTGKLVLSIKL
jgi:hypothetical protein